MSTYVATTLPVCWRTYVCIPTAMFQSERKEFRGDGYLKRTVKLMINDFGRAWLFIFFAFKRDICY